MKSLLIYTFIFAVIFCVSACEKQSDINAAGDAKADNKEFFQKDGTVPNKNTPLVDAIKQGNDGEIELLIKEGADVNVKDDKGLPILILAAKEGRKDIVEILGDNKTELNTQDEKGYTALMYLAEGNHIGGVEALIRQGADINIKNKKGKTALKIAEAKGNKIIADILRKANTEK